MKQNHDTGIDHNDYEYLQNRLCELDKSITMPPSLLPENLRGKIPPSEVQRFETIGRPNFAVWQRYGSLVATMIVLLVIIVMFVNRDVWLGGQFESTGDAALPEQAIATEEETQSDEGAQDSTQSSSRSRLYADDSEEVLQALSGLGAAVTTPSQSLSDLDTNLNTSTYAVNEMLSEMATISIANASVGTQSTHVVADIAVSDGQHLFYYTPQSHLQEEDIIHIVSAEDMQKVSEIALPASTNSVMYLYGQRLVVISSDAQVSAEEMYGGTTNTITEDHPAELNQTYSVTAVAVYDISDISSPSLERSFWQDGEYVDCHVADNQLYLITQKDLYYQNALLPDPQTYHVMPVIRDSQIEESYSIDASHIAIAPDAAHQTYTVISLLDVSAPQTPATSQAVLGSGNLYMSSDAAYFYYDTKPTGGVGAVGIIKMNLDSDMQISAQTEIDGDLSRPFAISEQDDVLQLATVSIESGTGRVRNNVYLLDSTLRMLGSVEGMLSDNSVSAYRLLDNRVYVQTHEDAQSVYTMDLSDPYDPAILGWFDLENFSGQAKSVGNGLVLGLGGVSNEMSLWMYSMGPLPPIELSREDLPGNQGYSQALSNPNALLWNPQNSLLGLPIICRQSTNGLDDLLYWGYAVYEYENEVGFTWRGIISHTDQLDESYILTNLHSVERGILLGQTLYTFSGSTVLGTDISNMQTVSRLSLV